MSAVRLFRARGTARLGGLVSVLLAASVVAAPAAAAAPEVTVQLSPTEIVVTLMPVENGGILDPAAPDDVAPWVDVPVEWGGSLVVQLPETLDGSAMAATLDLSAEPADVPTRTYSTTEPAPDDLTLTDLGDGQYGLTLPADDATNGPYGFLMFDGVTAVSGGDVLVAPLGYSLEFTGTGTSTVPLTTQVVALGGTPCALSADGPCADHPLTAGSSFAVTVPADSPLRALGLGSLATLQVVLQRVDGDGRPTDDPPVDLAAAASGPAGAEELPRVLAALAGAGPDADGIALTQAAGLITPAGPYNAVVTLPADLAAGLYDVALLEGTAAAVSISYFRLDVRPAPPAAPLLNAGLRSETGWTGQAAGEDGSSGTPLVVLGAGMLLTAGLVGGRALRPSRRGAACDG